jgi:hypothetical protein
MSRARRLASAVVAASLAVGGLSACRTESSVAAYLGNSEKISEEQIQEIWDADREVFTKQAEIEAAAAEEAQRAKEKQLADSGQKVTPAPTVTAQPVRMPFSRVDIAHALISRELYEQTAARRGLSLPGDLVPEDVARQNNLPFGTDYARIMVDVIAWRSQLARALGTPPAPSDADLRTVYDSLGKAGGIQPGQDFAAWKSSVPPQGQQQISVAAAIRDQVQAVASDLGVTVNPRYEPFQVALLKAGDENITVDLITTDFGDYQPLPVKDVS